MFAGLLILVAGLPQLVRAQVVVPLVSFAHEWRYDNSGIDRGTEWREVDYDDSGWATGRGLLEFGETTSYPVPFLTVLDPPVIQPTAYFRARFDCPAELAGFRGLEIFSTNYVDDGCVVYFNGVEAARLRVPSNQVFQTIASSGANEGVPDIVRLNPQLLRERGNVLAVEVHQGPAISGDVVWGAALAAHISEPLSIVEQPQGSTNMLNEPATLTVRVDGSPVFYRWWRAGVPLVGATNATVVVGPVSTSSAVDYFVVVSNAYNVVTSDVARVAFVPDLRGPKVVSATVRSDIASAVFVDMVFTEPVTSSAFQVSDFNVIQLRTGAVVPVQSVVASALLVRLRLETSDVVPYDDYVIVVRRARDASGNFIAPDTRVAVGWPVQIGLIRDTQEWLFHNSAALDPNVYGEPWTETNFVASGFWGRGSGLFRRYSQGFGSCFGWVGPNGPGGIEGGLDIGYQIEPYLFRTAFWWPPTNEAPVTLAMRFLVDDGAVFYLNGKELYRQNAPGGAIAANARALTWVRTPGCVTNVFVTATNLVPGSNWISVAILQTSFDSDGDACFGLELDGRYVQKPVLPVEPAPTLVRTNVLAGMWQWTWNGGGYVLESTTNMESSASYPMGPWVEVRNMANPYWVQPTNEPARFYRLRQR